jgi:ribosome-binding factor A
LGDAQAGSGPRSTSELTRLSTINFPTTVKNRLDRVNELIKRELDGLIRKDVQMPAKLVTVKEVDIAPDLKHAKVWMGMIGTQEEQHASMAKLHAARKELQSALSRRVILKFTPQLHFKLDETGERGDRVLNILNELNLPAESGPKETDPDDAN